MNRSSIIAFSFLIALTLPALSACDIKTVIANGTGIGGDQNKNHAPVITAFTANPTNTSAAGQVITFSIDAIDKDNDVLSYTWTATGGTLSTTTGRLVSWTPPTATGTYTVQVSLSDGKGGTAEGAQNIIVKADGTAKVGQ
jgi:hypothetical protein